MGQEWAAYSFDYPLVRLLKSVIFFFKVLYFFYFIKHAIKYLIIKPLEPLNTIPSPRTKTIVNNLLMSKF